MVLGTSGTAVQAPGSVAVGTLGSAGDTPICLNTSNQIAPCSGSGSGTLSGEVTGTLNATVVSSVGGQTASSINTAVTAVSNATNLNNANAIVKRNSSGNFTAGTITANLNGNATTATNFSGNLAGDVAGAQGTTSIQPNAVTAAKIASNHQFNGNFEEAEMVKAFILSGEYRSRF